MTEFQHQKSIWGLAYSFLLFNKEIPFLLVIQGVSTSFSILA